MNRISEKELNLLEACQSANDWHIITDRMKADRGGEWPEDWWEKVKMSGMMERIMSRWGATSDLTVKGFPNKSAMLQWLNRN